MFPECSLNVPGIFTHLYQVGVDSPDPAHEGRTALHAAAGAGNLPLVKLLLASGATLNAASSGGDIPLHDAARGGHVEVSRGAVYKN